MKDEFLTHYYWLWTSAAVFMFLAIMDRPVFSLAAIIPLSWSLYKLRSIVLFPKFQAVTKKRWKYRRVVVITVFALVVVVASLTMFVDLTDFQKAVGVCAVSLFAILAYTFQLSQ